MRRFTHPLPVILLIVFILAGGTALVGMYPRGVRADGQNRGKGESKPPSVLMPDEQDMLARVRDAALNGDVSRKDDILRCLASKHPTIRLAGMHAAALLALPEADQILQTIAATSRDDFTRMMAKVCLSRLRAEVLAAGLTSGSDKAAACLRKFLVEMNLTSETVNSASADYSANSRTRSFPPTEVWALRQIADMAYRGEYGDYSRIPDFTGLHFGSDAWASLVARFAMVPKATRPAALADFIADSAIWGAEAPLAAQLLADAGDTGCQAAADKLKTMLASAKTYPANGWEGLMRVLEARQAMEYEPLLKDIAAHGPKDAAWQASLYSQRLNHGYRSVMEHGL